MKQILNKSAHVYWKLFTIWFNVCGFFMNVLCVLDKG